MLSLLAGVAFAQLQVQVTPRTVYVGDTFQLSVSLEGDTLKSVNASWSPEVTTLGSGVSTSIINGAVSSALNYSLYASEPGTYRLTRLTAQTQSGKTLTYDRPLSIEVKPLEVDAACSLTLTAEPNPLFIEDLVTLTITLRVPALHYQNQKFLPFLQTDFFGRTSVRPPALRFSNALSDDAPVQIVGEPRPGTIAFEDDTAIYTQQLTLKAVRAGDFTFPAPIVNDSRLLDDGTQKRCFVKGNALTLSVQGPPTENRPAGFTGAIGSTFTAQASVDMLNVNVGDPVQLTLTFLSDSSPSLLRAPELPEIHGFRAVGEAKRESLEGGARFTYTLRPTQAGLLELPPLPLAWFNRSAMAYEKTQTAPIPLQVRPSAQLVLEDLAERLVPPPLALTSGAQPSVAPWPLTWRPWSPTADAFERERTLAASTFAQSPEDFVTATEGWLKQIAAGDRSREALMNATSCALLAKRPEIAERTLQLRTLLWGEDADAQQAQALIDEQFNQPPPWTHRLFAWHFRLPFAQRLTLFCGILLLAVVTFPLKKLRWLMGLLLLLSLVSVGLSTVQLFHELPQTVEVRK